MAGSTVMMLPVLDALKTAIELEFRAFEIFGEFPQCVCDEVTEYVRREGLAMVKSSSIALALHSPFTSLNIAALNPGIRAESVRQVLAAIDLCADMGGKRVIVHNGDFIFTEGFRKRSSEAFKVQWHYNIESLKRAAQRAEERGVVLCLENIGFEPKSIGKNADDMLRIRDETGSPALAFCIDIGHARLNNELPQVIEKLGPFTRHIHFTDNFGENDDHVVIGTGNFDYSPYLDFFRNFKDILTLEVISLSTDRTPAIQSRENITRILSRDSHPFSLKKKG